MSELWKDIDGFNGAYQVSNYGRVRSFVQDKINGRVMKISHYPNGYAKVKLGKAGPEALIHRLVAKAFIPGDHDLQVNHKDGVRDHNHATNLEWISCSDNHKHSYRELNRKRHSKTRTIVLVRKGEEMEFDAMNHAAGFLNRSVGSVASAAKRGSLCAGWEVHHAI